METRQVVNMSVVNMSMDAGALETRVTPTVLRALDLLRTGGGEKIAGLIRGDIDSFFREAAYSAEKLRLFIRCMALALMRTDLYSAAVTCDLFEMLISGGSNDPEIVRGYAAVMWLRAQHDPTDMRGVEAARLYVKSAPETPDAHRLLGSAALSCGLFQEAYLAYSAAAAVAGYDVYGMNRQLAKLLMQGAQVVRFTFENLDYMFELATFSTQAVEAGAHHACARLTEPDELALTRSFVEKGASIVEVGALVGNHTVFFLKNLAPRSIRVFEANPRAAVVVERNVAHNLDDGAVPRPTVQVTNAFVGEADQAATAFAGATTPCIRLSQAVSDPADFIKIDVDGAELAVLAGAEAILAAHRPKIMLEVNAVTRRDAGEWLAARGYMIEHEIEQSGYSNLFLSPIRSPK